MRLTITVTDGQEVSVETPTETTARADQNGKVETFDGGPVPDVLLGMESQVAAGLLPPPGSTV